VRLGFAERQSFGAASSPENDKTRPGKGRACSSPAGFGALPAGFALVLAGGAARRGCGGGRAGRAIALMATHLAGCRGITRLGGGRRLNGGSAALGGGGARCPLGEGRAAQRESKAGGEKRTSCPPVLNCAPGDMTAPARRPCDKLKVFSGLLRRRHGGHGAIAAAARGEKT